MGKRPVIHTGMACHFITNSIDFETNLIMHRVYGSHPPSLVIHAQA